VFAAAAQRPAKRGSTRVRSRDGAAGYGTLGTAKRSVERRSRQGAIYLGRPSGSDSQRHRQHLGPRTRAAMGNRRSDPRRSVARAVHPGSGLEPRPTCQDARPRLRQPLRAMREYLDRDGSAPWRGRRPSPPIILAASTKDWSASPRDAPPGVPYFSTAAHISEVRRISARSRFWPRTCPSSSPPDLAARGRSANRHLDFYLGFDQLPNNLLRIGWSSRILETARLGPSSTPSIAAGRHRSGSPASLRERFEAGRPGRSESGRHRPSSRVRRASAACAAVRIDPRERRRPTAVREKNSQMIRGPVERAVVPARRE